MCGRADCKAGRVPSFAGSMACPECRPGTVPHTSLGMLTQMNMQREEMWQRVVAGGLHIGIVTDEMVEKAAARIRALRPDLFREPHRWVMAGFQPLPAKEFRVMRPDWVAPYVEFEQDGDL